MSVTHPKSKIYGLLGYPLVHSFSASYFNQKFESEGIDAEYINFEIDDISKIMEIVSEYPRLNGLNVTAPYKEQVIPYLNSIDDAANAIGAVNTIQFLRNAKTGDLQLRGFNTDVIGFSNSIEPLLNDDRRSALVLGTGGASKAVSYALAKLGVEVDHVSRRKSAHTITYEELTKAMVQSHLIVVNCTPLGMYPNIDVAPDFPYRFLTPAHLCYDLVYNPDNTLFMRHCQEQGSDVKNGLEMLLLQGFASYEIWNSVVQ